jgi:hypothetical protein
MQALIHPALPIAGAPQLAYVATLNIMFRIFGQSAFVFSLLSVLLIFAQALWLNLIAIRHRLFHQNTYLVAFVFLLLSALHPSLSHFNAQLLINFILIFLINEFLLLKQAQSANKHLFNIGFALSIAALFQFTVLFLVPFVFSALLILRPLSIREWMIALVGMIMPLYIVTVVLFCFDHLSLMTLWPDIGISLPRQLKPAKYYLIIFASLIVLLAGSMYNMQLQLPKAPIYIRRYWIMLSILFVCTLLVASFTDSLVSGAWMICLPTLSLILAHIFQNERSKKMNAISFYFALLLVLFSQIFLPI